MPNQKQIILPGQLTCSGERDRNSRRAFMRNGTLVLAATAAMQEALSGESSSQELRIGLVTDLHFADKPPAGSRYYRETAGKLEEAAGEFRKSPLSFAVELGDLIDAAESVAVELDYLKQVNDMFSAISNDRHYVLGNHCVDTLHKEEFLDQVGQARSYYSFDRGAFHFVVLDSCFRSDGVAYGRKNSKWNDANIPEAELDWLESDLAATDKQTIVFAHQRLDVSTAHGVKNNVKVRQILERSGRVAAVLQGHSHQNDLKKFGGIFYCTLVAMVEGSGRANNGYSTMTISPAGMIEITGFRRQRSYRWS